MKLFQVDKEVKSVQKPLVKILISIAILTVCFFRNRFIPADQVFFTHAATVVTLILLVVCFRLIFISITEIGICVSSRKQEQTKPIAYTEPIKLWSHEELFAFLEEENHIDLVVENDYGKQKIGTRSDYGRPTAFSREQFFDKCYYIEDREYTDFEEFKTEFLQNATNEQIKIWSAMLDDMEVQI
jgi:hypothetical protein